MNTPAQQITVARLARRGFTAEPFVLGTVRVAMRTADATVDVVEAEVDDVFVNTYQGMVIDRNRGRHLFSKFNLPQLVEFLNKWQ